MYYNKIRINYLAVEMTICAIAKFVLDYLRYSNIGKVITINQIICFMFFILGAVILYKGKRKDKRT